VRPYVIPNLPPKSERRSLDTLTSLNNDFIREREAAEWSLQHTALLFVAFTLANQICKGRKEA